MLPLITYSSPSRAISMPTLVASEEATFGSVMAKQLRISPASSGSSHCFFWSSVPKRASTSMLPVSGEGQLVHCAANSMWLDVPMISHRPPLCSRCF